MNPEIARHRVTLHVEGRNNNDEPVTAHAQTADFEKVITTELIGPVSRIQLLQRICGWLCSESLLHEHSEEVAMRIQNTVQEGVVHAAAPGTTECLVGRDTSPTLRLKVHHEIVEGGVALALGSLAVHLDACLLETSVQALRIVCALDNDTFMISCHLTPVISHAAYSECHSQHGCVCSALRVGALLLSTQSETTGVNTVRAYALSHRNRRLQSQAQHKRDLLSHATVPAEDCVGLEQKVLSRKVTMLSSPHGVDAVMHTVFFR